MLKEIRKSYCLYFIDVKGRRQGEYKEWYTDKQLRLHYVYVDGQRHGEYKWWWMSGQIADHCFYVNDFRTTFHKLPYPSTPEELMVFKLKYDIQLLPVEENVNRL